MKKLLALFFCVGIIVEAGILTVILTEKYKDPYDLDFQTIVDEIKEKIGTEKFDNITELQEKLDQIIIRGISEITASNAEQPSDAQIDFVVIDHFKIDQKSFVLESVLVEQ